MTIKKLTEPGGRIVGSIQTPSVRATVEAAHAKCTREQEAITRQAAANVANRQRAQELRWLSAPEPATAQPLRETQTRYSQALREAYGRLGLPEDQASIAAALPGNPPVPAPAPAPAARDAWDQLAGARNMPPGSAAIMRRGRFQ